MLAQVSLVAIFLFLLMLFSVGFNETFRKVGRRFCRISGFGAPVPSDDTLQICSESNVTENLVDNVGILLKVVCIRGVLCGR